MVKNGKINSRLILVYLNFDEFSERLGAYIFKIFLPLRANHGAPSGDTVSSESPDFHFSNVGMSASTHIFSNL